MSGVAHAERVRRRIDRFWPVVAEKLGAVYGGNPEGAAFIHALERKLTRAALDRPPALWALDYAREADLAWIGRSGNVVYSFYVDRFAGRLSGVSGHADYLAELGVRWLHPLPLLRHRPGDSDGGFAVADYREVDPRLGTMADLESLTASLRAREMGLILDVVCNHTAREHDWARKARAGDPAYRDYYITVPDKSAVAEWERHLTDVFPQTAPGNFTHDAEMGGHVWTTFYPFQWDLNYANPCVFQEMLEVLIFLAARGVQGFRLDSSPFLWKTPGTNCRNQPQAHAIVEAWRAAMSIVAPSVVLIAEAIESLEDVLPFFGGETPGCDLAYNNGVMTALWGALADGNVAPLRDCLAASTLKPSRAAWLNYVRCHDDIIWNALSRQVPVSGLKSWADFYAGAGNSFARGKSFQTGDTGVPSTNGMTASLAGGAVTGAVRIELLYGIIHALDGWPLIYMGDEIGLENNEDYACNPEEAADGRWLHRPFMAWDRAEQRHKPGSAPARLFASFKRFADAARALSARGVSGPSRPCGVGAGPVLAFLRDGGPTPFLCLANFAATPVRVDLPAPFSGMVTDLLRERRHKGKQLLLEPYGLLWLTPSA